MYWADNPEDQNSKQFLILQYKSIFLSATDHNIMEAECRID